ncbi:hypothetical protein PF011_g27954 [Phytophthora fragariae]|uniref:Uncharacterized protein n=1 Tax=Phytophthora fragariae TaxID=53985 RepID=A0A6A3HA54_9STRA|nr:hypothetical protein PF011_g27954 [Phytophthora fragariae]
MDRLPFFEKLLGIYKQMIFTPSRAAAVRGGYYRNYLLSSDLKATALEAALRGDRAANGTDMIKLRALFRLKHVSKIFRLMLKDDKSFLGGVSLKALIARAVDICSEELFETRVLSRDMLKFHDDLSDTFSEMCGLLGERWMRDKKQQARAILDLLEKRFLKLRFQRAKLSCFRELVHTYSEARDEMGLGKTSNTDSFRALEWYITPTLDDYQAQINLDGMDGQPFYFELVTTAFQDTSKFERASAMVPGIACYGDSVKRIVYGGPKELLNRGRELVVAVAKAEGVRLSERNSQKCMASFRVGEFVFSAAGVCRDTAAA